MPGAGSLRWSVVTVVSQIIGEGRKPSRTVQNDPAADSVHHCICQIFSALAPRFHTRLQHTRGIREWRLRDGDSKSFSLK